ncbi:MAG TPA: hypothetical protein VL981_09550 [Candidatus Methylacidiphilales bacterium]|nr:hypothetical protein [Candidatus Methylacidiphilales bacterium]
MKSLLPFAGLVSLWLVSLSVYAEGLRLITIHSHGGYVETAHVSCYQDRIYIGGWLKPHFWSGRAVSFRVDVKDAEGKVIATKTGSANPTGRPQMIVQFGVAYVVLFKDSQIGPGSAH